MHTALHIANTLATTQTRFSRRGFWLLAALLLAILSLLAWLLHRSVVRSVQRLVEGQLVGEIEVKTQSLAAWLDAEQRHVVQSIESERTAHLLMAVLRQHTQIEQPEGDESDIRQELASVLSRTSELVGATGYFVADRTGLLVLNSDLLRVGERLPSEYSQYLVKLAQDESVVVPPHILPSTGSSSIPDNSLETGSNAVRKQEMCLCVMVPAYRSGADGVGAVGFLLDASGTFSELLCAGSFHSHCRAYAIDSYAQMLSRSDNSISKVIKPTSQLSLSVSKKILVRDPGVDMTAGGNPKLPPEACPMTVAAAGIVMAASQSNDTIHTQMTAYRDYQGVAVVGAWRWLPQYGFGLIAEIPTKVAFSTVHNFRYGLWGLVGLLSFSLVGALFFAKTAQAVFRRLGKAEKQLAKMGQYELLDKIGQGGMGEVYRARHALLRRETAVKICQLGATSASANHRFQREVQAASQLNNPHTVRIFDYGQSENGTFFYAMELLHGLNLTGLIRQFGTLADGRTIFILKQICESLAEAHGLGLVHRDIKPSNVMIGRRGGIPDFVKVLDFGLVRNFGTNRTVSLTLEGCIAGTPHYMSPEASQNPQDVDPRSDLYSLGCLAFHLLCGQPPFKGSNPLEICLKQVREQPPSIQDQCLVPICRDLSEIVMHCISKSPDDRPQSALELMSALESAKPLNPWSREDAELWWRNNAEVASKVMVAGPDTQASMHTKTPN